MTVYGSLFSGRVEMEPVSELSAWAQYFKQMRDFIEVDSSMVFCGRCCCWVTLRSFPCCSWARQMYEKYFGGNNV